MYLCSGFSIVKKETFTRTWKHIIIFCSWTSRTETRYIYKNMVFSFSLGNSTFPQSNCNNSQCSDNNHKGKERNKKQWFNKTGESMQRNKGWKIGLKCPFFAKAQNNRQDLHCLKFIPTNIQTTSVELIKN